MDFILEFLSYMLVFSVYAFGGALSFALAISSLKRGKIFRTGLWAMLFVFHIIGLAYMRFNY